MTVDLRLYGIVGGGIPADPVEGARLAAMGGATLIQYRDKTAGGREMAATARAIRGALAATDVPLIVNDRVDVAAAAGAGIHLGQEDLLPQDARAILGPDAIIGLTIKNSRHVAEAPLDVIDYAAVGGVFATTSKDNPDPPVGLDGLKALCAALRARRPGLPIVAIAGIGAENASPVIEAGADGVSVISAIFAKSDIALAAGKLRRIVDAALEASGRARP
ncbi:MAG: thiamine phosphate synthase [Flavobacteriaceae bacterium]